MYYLNSRYYDPEVGRFINADTTDVLGIQADLYNKNLFAYCDNNPVMRKDSVGEFWVQAVIIAAGGIIGGLLGAFSAASTGENVLEGTIEGCLTGIVGSTCGLLIDTFAVGVLAGTIGGAIVDLGTQVVSQFIENKSVDVSKINYGRTVKTAIQTGLGTAIPKFGQGAGNAVDAFGTALIWAEGATVITCADIVITNFINAGKSYFNSRNSLKIRGSIVGAINSMGSLRAF